MFADGVSSRGCVGAAIAVRGLRPSASGRGSRSRRSAGKFAPRCRSQLRHEFASRFCKLRDAARFASSRRLPAMPGLLPSLLDGSPLRARAPRVRVRVTCACMPAYARPRPIARLLQPNFRESRDKFAKCVSSQKNRSETRVEIFYASSVQFGISHDFLKNSGRWDGDVLASSAANFASLEIFRSVAKVRCRPKTPAATEVGSSRPSCGNRDARPTSAQAGGPRCAL